MHTSTFWLKFGSLSLALTLKNRSRSPKSNQLFIMSQCYIHANLVEICQPVHEIWCTQALLDFWLNFGGLSLTVTLKIRSRSPKPIQLFIMPKYYIHANLVKIPQLVHEILCKQAPFGSNLAVLSPTLTLKNRSRSPKSNQLFIISQCYIHANIVEICQSVHEIWCTQVLLGLNLAV